MARDPLDYHDVSIALSKARAALWLLDGVTGRNPHLSVPVGGIATTERDAEEIADWLRSIAIDTLQVSLDEADEAFRADQDREPDLHGKGGQ